MDAFELIRINIFSPVVLAFLLGIIATVVRSDLKFPSEIYTAISIYLLFSLGLKGGVELSHYSFYDIWKTFLATLLLGLITPLIAYFLARILGKMDHPNASAMAAHYGSVSVVTFLSVVAFLDDANISHESYLTTMVVVLEVPAIILGLSLANLKRESNQNLGKVFGEILRGKSILLLVGGLVIGAISGNQGFSKVEPFFVAPFQGIVTLFLLEMGMVASQRLRDLKKTGGFLVAFAVVVPMINGLLGVWFGHLSGLSLGGCTVLGTLASSASYIAAPAAVRVGIPSANPTFYLTASLGITFPFNLVVGIPLYYKLAQMICN
jgi:hypothetical protein